MISITPYKIPLEKIKDAVSFFDESKKHDLSFPLGDFFYDPWELKPEYKGTIWEDIWKSLPIDKGQSRVIILKSGTNYFQHADIDDRYHLSLQGDSSYLIDLENDIMHKCSPDGIWYEMDAGRLHTAASFGKENRIQLVVRKLLQKNNIINPIHVKITGTGETYRYDFDNTMSVWLNYANKNKKINSFRYSENVVQFNLEKSSVEELKSILPSYFNITISDND